MEDAAENPEKDTPAPKAGELVRTARLAAGIEPAKLCADLRISTDALAALEAGQYNRLPGDPYVRALFGSICRQLRIDSADILKAYSLEMGGASASAPVAPYKDLSQTHILAHKQIFILILGVLLLTLLLILGKLNTSPDGSDSAAAAPVDSLAAPAADSMPESQALRPDSVADSVARAVLDSAAPPEPVVPPPAPANKVVVKPVLDSVWIRVQRAGKPEAVQLLLLGKQMEVTHSDTIALILGKRKSVEITVGDSTLIPAKKRFRIVGNRITYY